MKRLLSLLLALLLLTGCAFAPSEYASITDHTGVDDAGGDDDALTADDYNSLKQAILSFVRTGTADGSIVVTRYDGDVEADLTQAAYEVSKLDPLGAYAVDYMTHDCVRIVSYYEIRIRTTFRRTKAELDAIRMAYSDPQIAILVQLAVEQGADRLTLRLTDYHEQDFAAITAEYCAARPETVMETPKVSVSVYPDSGESRIAEINFQYNNTLPVRELMKESVATNLNAAAEYIRYRETPEERTALLFTYLTQRFRYTQRETQTPLYDSLCRGVADPEGLATAWQLICDRVGVPCYTVRGIRNGEEHVWNIIADNGYYRHVDLARCVLELGALTLWTDGEMTEYYWNPELYPPCEPVPPPQNEEPPVTEEETEETTGEEDG